MTEHIILTTLALIAFAISLKIILKKDQKLFPAKLFTLMLFLILPLSFRGLTVIAHFLFESSSESLLPYSLVYLPLLFLSGFYLQKINKKKLFESNIFKVLSFVLLTVFALWYLFAVTQSQYETGTPTLTDNWQMMTYWASIELYVVSLFTIIFNFIFRNKKRYFLMIVSLLFFIVHMMILMNNFFGLF